MLVPSDEESNSDEELTAITWSEIKRLKRHFKKQDRQMDELWSIVMQLTSQLMATRNEKMAPKPKMAPPEKYEGGRLELGTFLTNIDIYCEFNNVPNDQEKILMANLHMKGRAATWMKPYVEDFLASPDTYGTRAATQALFWNWVSFKQEMRRVFGETNEERQAARAMSRLRQTTSVSAYTTAFRQLQQRISSWGEGAFMDAYERGLKEIIKDNMIDWDQPKTMQELVELATRIDNRLWNGAQQKARLQPTTANMKKHRNRTDKDGDTYMTDKFQIKVKNKKSQGTNQDNISKKERQKRYDNKACLRCGAMGHFRRDCPKNEVRQTAVMADMGNFRTSELEPIVNTKDDVSDIAVYDETRLPGREHYVKLPQPIQMEEIGSWDDPQDVEGVLYEVGALQQLAQMQYWVCGDTKHLANDCTRLGRIGTTGYNTQNAIYQAPNQQPYLEEELAEAFDQELSQKSTCTRYKHLHWVDCKQRRYSPTPCTNMTKQLSLNDHYDGNEYSWYKSHEEEALKTLFKDGNYKRWSVQEIYHAAEQALPLLSKRDLSNVIDLLQKSIMSRKKVSLRFRSAPKRSQMGHAYWTDMMQRICKLA